jgi:hypothetical protein
MKCNIVLAYTVVIKMHRDTLTPLRAECDTHTTSSTTTIKNSTSTSASS